MKRLSQLVWGGLALMSLSTGLASTSFALLKNDSVFDPRQHRPACMST